MLGQFPTREGGECSHVPDNFATSRVRRCADQLRTQADVSVAENRFLSEPISFLNGGQFVSHVLQWNTKAPDFNAASNSSRLNGIVWL
jgi:hypothetical protein